MSNSPGSVLLPYSDSKIFSEGWKSPRSPNFMGITSSPVMPYFIRMGLKRTTDRQILSVIL